MGEVSGIIAASIARTDTAIADAGEYLKTLEDIAKDTSLGYSGSYSLTPWLGFNTQLPPMKNIAERESGRVSPSLEIDDAPDVSGGRTDFTVWEATALPLFTKPAPTITYGNAPTTAMPIAPTAITVDPPSLAAWDMRMGKITGLPEMVENYLPEPDVLNLEPVDLTTFNIGQIIDAPTNTFSFVEEEYSSALRDAIEALIQGDIEDGGYGINADDERALYNRALDREAKSKQTAIIQVRRGMAARGFALPAGSLYQAERAAAQQAEAAMSATNRDIYLKRSELYVQARQFAVQAGTSLDNAMLNYVGAKQERALNAAKTAATIGIEFFNAALARAQLEIAERNIYRDLHAEHRATVIAKLEEWRARVQRVEADDRINNTRLKHYDTSLSVVELLYKGQELRDRHDSIEIEIEKLRLQDSRNKLDHFTAKVQALGQEWSNYQTAINAERLKLDVYKTEVDAYRALISAEVEVSNRSDSQFRAQLAVAENKRQESELKLRAYDAQLRATLARFDGDLKENAFLMDEWKTNLAIDEKNVANDISYDIRQQELYHDGFRVNITNLQAVTSAINEFKAQGAAAADKALDLYADLIRGAETATTAVGTLIEDATA